MSIYDFNGNLLSGSGESSGMPIEDLLYNFRKWNGKKFVLHGNSLTGWGGYLAQYLGMTQTSLTYNLGSLTGAKTAAELIEFVETAYPTEADLIILQGDGNTSWGGEPSDQLDGESATNTWAARVNYLMRCLRARYPNVIIVLMVDSVWYADGKDQYELDKNRTMYSKIKALAEYNRCAFFDVDHNTPFNPMHGFENYYTGKAVSTDNVDYVHPNKKYLEAKGKAVAQFVASLVYNPEAPNNEIEGWQDRVSASA